LPQSDIHIVQLSDMHSLILSVSKI